MAIQLKHLHTSNFTHRPKPSLSAVTRHRQSALQCANAVSGVGKGQQLIQSGAVRAVQPKEAVAAMESEGYVLLDVRPEWEREKARVLGSVHVPLFVRDRDGSPLTLLKKWVHFGYIGLWTGQYFTMINPLFLQQVETKVPDKDSKLLLACGEGLRSMMAASKLHGGGYSNLGWLAGGFNRAGDNDFPAVEGPEKLQYATIGGVSYYFLKLVLLLQDLGKNSQNTF
ncbi:rhodanese-like domain-containing protein 10 [Diospyros lotus]|uniref:rhodanese-like domain-containing protein 10 n=1 Tax=Diospyros lotus TaxID=55363 RepID=UPI0022522A96|nr:rhodanese-like domain-containing protein 10 [Diospyros lotus]